MPKARVRIATRAKPRSFRSVRSANLRSRMTRSIVRSASVRDPPVGHLDDPPPVRRVHVGVRHLHDRGALVVEPLEQLHDLLPLGGRSEEHTSELQSLAYLVCRLLLEKKKKQ